MSLDWKLLNMLHWDMGIQLWDAFLIFLFVLHIFIVLYIVCNLE